MALISEVKRGANVEENEWQASGSEKDNVNEIAAADTELVRSGTK